MKKEDKAALKRYIDDYLERFLTIPLDIYAAIIRNFSTDYDLKELTLKLNLRSVVVNNLDQIVEDNNIDLFVDTLTENNHPDLGYFWNLLSKSYACFTQPVIEKYIDNWDWNVISSLNPSDDFVNNNLININWGFVECTEKTLPFFQKYEDKIKFDKVDWGTLDWEVIEKYIHKIKDIKFKTKIDEKGLTYGACANDFIEKYKEFVPTLTYMEVLSRSMDNVPTNWEEASAYFQLDEEFIDDMSHRVNWEIISECQNMSLDLMLKYSDKINIKALEKNVKISQEIKNEFLIQKSQNEDAEQLEEDVEEDAEEIEMNEEIEDTEENDEENDEECLIEDDGTPVENINFVFTDEKSEKEISYNFNFANKDYSKIEDVSKLLEAIQLTYGSMKELEHKHKQGIVNIKFMVKNVDIKVLEEEINEFLEERDWKK